MQGGIVSFTAGGTHVRSSLRCLWEEKRTVRWQDLFERPLHVQGLRVWPRTLQTLRPHTEVAEPTRKPLARQCGCERSLCESKLPKPHQQAINSFEWQRKCQEIGEQHNLSESDVTGLQAEVALVLMGLSDLRALHRYIDDEIAGTGWQDIEASVINDIISPIGEIFEIIASHDG